MGIIYFDIYCMYNIYDIKIEMRGKGVKTMRLFEKQKQTKTPMQVFNNMMEGISEIIEFYDGQITSKNNTSEETVYNYVMRNENGLVKIGISHDVEFRKRTLENAGGYFIPEVHKYVTEGGLETYNLFSLYLLLYLREKYNINKIILKNGLFCSICGYTVYLEDPKIDFCKCADWYLAVYEQTHEF